MSKTLDRDECLEFEGAKCHRVSRSGKAILASFPDIDGEKLWIPLSQIHDDSEVYGEGDEGKLVISEWIAKQKGLASP